MIMHSIKFLKNGIILFKIENKIKSHSKITVKSPSLPKIIADIPEKAPNTTFIITGFEFGKALIE